MAARPGHHRDRSPTVVITEDVNNDGAKAVAVSLPGDAKAGDTLTRPTAC